jgi:hypothetical protein
MFQFDFLRQVGTCKIAPKTEGGGVYIVCSRKQIAKREWSTVLWMKSLHISWYSYFRQAHRPKVSRVSGISKFCSTHRLLILNNAVSVGFSRTYLCIVQISRICAAFLPGRSGNTLRKCIYLFIVNCTFVLYIYILSVHI